MTTQGLGASLSPAIGGAIAQAVGYRVAFLALARFTLASLTLWLAFTARLKHACAAQFGAERALRATADFGRTTMP